MAVGAALAARKPHGRGESAGTCGAHAVRGSGAELDWDIGLRVDASPYHALALARWARHVKAYRSGALPRDARRVDATPVPRVARDVYVYFDNDAHAHAPRDAQRLIAQLPGQRRRTRLQAVEESHAT